MSKEEVILKLMQLALKIESETNRCMFFEYHGHVNWVEIRIAESIEDYNNILERFIVYFDDSNYVEQFNEVYESLNKYIA